MNKQKKKKDRDKIQRNQSQFNKFEKSVAIRTKKITEKTQITKIRNKSRDITTDSTEIRKIREDYKQLYANKLDN